MKEKETGPALLIGIGGKSKGKGVSGEDEPDGDEVPDMGDEKDMHLDAAYDALEKGDREGFKEAMKKCLLVADEGGYTGPEDEDEG